MSQLAKAIRATDTGQRKFIPKGISPLFTTLVETKAKSFETYDMGAVATCYRIEAHIGAQVVITEEHSLEPAIERTKRNIIEAVFGEFRSHFRMIDHALNTHDVEEARKLLYAFEDQMFDPTV